MSPKGDNMMYPIHMPIQAMFALIAAFVFMFTIVFTAIHIYAALALMTIGNKLKYKQSWIAFIPFANLSMILQLGGFHWAWVFLLLVPVAGWIALLILLFLSSWNICEARKFPGWLGLTPALMMIHGIGPLGLITSLGVLGVVAWTEHKHKRKR